MAWIKKSGQFLPDISKEELRKLFKNEKNAKGKFRLLAAIQRKDGKTLDDIASSLQRPKTTIHDWLKRLEEKSLSSLYDIKQSGKPARLTKDQERALEVILSSSPKKQNMPFVLWTTNLVQYVILKEFNVEFKVRQVRNITKKLNFTLQVPRPENRKANAKAQEEFKKKLKQKYNITVGSDSRSSVLMRPSTKLSLT